MTLISSQAGVIRLSRLPNFSMAAFLCLSATFLCLTATPVDAESTIVEETIVVTATRTEQPLAETLSSVSVLTRGDIERAQAVDLTELLVRLPGVDRDHSGGRGANASLKIRGTESDHTLVLIDGVRSFSATTGSTALQHIPLNQVERIEVVRGPKSSLYGADALGGVVQVFTKKGSRKGGDGFSGSLSTELGSHNLRKSTVGVYHALADTSLGINLSHEETDGIDRTYRDDLLDGDSDGYREFSAAATVQHSFAGGAVLAVNYLRSQGDTEFDGGADDYTEFVNETRALRLKAPFSEAFDMTLELSHFRDDADTFGSFPSGFETRRNAALLQGDYKLGTGHLISLGYDYYLDEVNGSTEFSETERDNKAVFIQYQGSFGDLQTNASLRGDDNESYGHHGAGSLALGYPLAGDTYLSVSYGSAFKAPTFNDLYFPFTDFGGGFFYQGNTGLEPEESQTLELSLRSQGAVLDWFLSVYRTDIENLIALNSSFTSVDNIDEAEISGAEVGASLAVLGWDTNISLSYTDPRDKASDEVLVRRARGKVYAEISRRFGKFDLSFAWRTQSHRLGADRVKLGGYNTLDIRSLYQLTPSFQVAAKVENVFDQDYTLVEGFATEGLFASASVRYSF